MSKLVLYHGSPIILQKPIFGAGKSYNDYGLGFYCTEHVELAKEWACNEGVDGFANQYELETDGLEILNLSTANYTILNWLAILLENRQVRLSTPIEKRGRDYLLENFKPEYDKYDVIVGYRADDSYFSFARSFLANGISLKQLSYAMTLGKLGEQVVLKSKKAFETLNFLGYTVADNSVYYAKRKVRDEQARKAFQLELEREDADGIFIRDIIKEEIKPNDARLR
jgi:hypothetical protein